ncbi:MAG: DUF3445 domain-containing protein [Geminicoccaceae bacterium]
MSDDPTLHQPSSAFRRTNTEVTAADAGRQLWLRVERQTLRRLPETGLVLFTILTLVEPLASLARDPRLAAQFATGWTRVPAAMLAYKNLATRRPAITSYLRARAAA